MRVEPAAVMSSGISRVMRTRIPELNLATTLHRFHGNRIWVLARVALLQRSRSQFLGSRTSGGVNLVKTESRALFADRTPRLPPVGSLSNKIRSIMIPQ